MTRTDLIEAPLIGAEQVAEKHFVSLRGLVIFITILALTISLANRTVQGGIHSKPTAHSATSIEKIQHRDNDASEWVAPVATFVLLRTTEPSVAWPSNQNILVAIHYDSLHNRPPPIS